MGLGVRSFGFGLVGSRVAISRVTGTSLAIAAD